MAEARSLLGGAGAGAGASAAGADSGRGASAVLRDLSTGLPALGPSDRRAARRILARPSEPNDEAGNFFGAEAGASPICDAHACVHWSTAAKHAPRPADGDGSGVPDYPEAVLAAAGQSYAVENGTLGWRDAVPDGGEGARRGRGEAGQVDIYLVDLGKRLFGYAVPDPRERGRSRSGYLVLENDYSGFSGEPRDLMRVTLAHEYNHILQFAYDVAQDGWMFESTATWIEDLVYPGINDYLNFIGDFAKSPFKPMAEVESKAFRLYGSAMWNHWLTAALGPETVRNAWQLSPSVKPRDFAVAAYDRAIAERGGGTFSRQFAAFAAESAEWNHSGAFPDAGAYPEVRRSGALSGKRKLNLDHTAYRLFKVKGQGSKRLRVEAESGTRSAIALVGRRPAAEGGGLEITSAFLRRGGEADIRLDDAGAYVRVTAVVVNADGRVRGSSRNYSRDERSYVVRLSG